MLCLQVLAGRKAEEAQESLEAWRPLSECLHPQINSPGLLHKQPWMPFRTVGRWGMGRVHSDPEATWGGPLSISSVAWV